MMKYKIASGDTLEFLEGYVNELIEQGYEPLGGVIYNPAIEIWTQAVFIPVYSPEK